MRGFEEKDLEIQKDSPTVGARENWAIKTTDTKSALYKAKN